VKVTVEDIRRQYAELSDEGLLELEPEDLMEQARKCYDEEMARRGLKAAQTRAPATPLTEAEPRAAEELVVAGTFQSVEQALQARELLQDAGIAAFLPKEYRAGMIGGLAVMVPATALESAREVLTPPSDLSYIRHGMGAVRPYVYGTLDLLDFVSQVFSSAELERSEIGPDAIRAEIMIGDSAVVLDLSDPPHASAAPSSILVYVPDVDATYELALEAGAVSLAEPADKPYDERSAGVKDSFGNTWWISTYTGA
jgi:PhnB protein